MTEYIDDVRHEDAFEGWAAMSPLWRTPRPGFRDRFGNIVIVGNWVTIAVRDGNVADVLLARVEAVEPKEMRRWTPDGVREYIGASVQVRSIEERCDKIGSFRFKRASRPNAANMVHYKGELPNVAE